MKRAFMIKKVFPVALGLSLLCSISCRRVDNREITINVDGLTNDLTARVVMNAVQYELVERQSDPNFAVDVKASTIAFSADGALKHPVVQKCLEDALAEVGLPSKILSADPAPTRQWTERHTARISVPEMKSTATANMAVAAIARAMRVVRGVKEENVTIDTAKGTVTVKYNSMSLSTKNLEHAIATVGLGTENVPSNLGTSGSVSSGW